MRKKIKILICFSVLFNLSYSQIDFLQKVYEIDSRKNERGYRSYSREELDTIVSKGIFSIIYESFDVDAYERQGYIKDKYLRILRYQPSGQAGISINEYKIIKFNNYSYLLSSEKHGINTPGFGFTGNELVVFRIENGNLLEDEKLKSKIEEFRDYKYFTNDKELIKESQKEDFVFEFEEEDNKISIVPVWGYNDIEEKLYRNKLILKFTGNKIIVESDYE